MLINKYKFFYVFNALRMGNFIGGIKYDSDLNGLYKCMVMLILFNESAKKIG